LISLVRLTRLRSWKRRIYSLLVCLTLLRVWFVGREVSLKLIDSVRARYQVGVRRSPAVPILSLTGFVIWQTFLKAEDSGIRAGIFRRIYPSAQLLLAVFKIQRAEIIWRSVTSNLLELLLYFCLTLNWINVDLSQWASVVAWWIIVINHHCWVLNNWNSVWSRLNQRLWSRRQRVALCLHCHGRHLGSVIWRLPIIDVWIFAVIFHGYLVTHFICHFLPIWSRNLMNRLIRVLGLCCSWFKLLNLIKFIL
jgi:hypothetical protein